MSIWSPGATHRGAPFVGRRREIGIMTHLLEEGLAGSLGLVLVAGEPGMGRRRLIAESLNRGPDAEWVHLAPGGVHADPQRWARTELLDLIETYPAAPYPSWALHALARWAPALHRHAAVPALSRERFDPAWAPELFGSAIGAVLRAITGQTLVIVDAGLWPDPETELGRVLTATAKASRAVGMVMLAAARPTPDTHDDLSHPGIRSLELEPLRHRDVCDLIGRWRSETDPESAALWLYRVTGGRPFYLHEVVRWLEEMGHVRVDDEQKSVVFLDPVNRLPLPLYLNAVMDSRYRRLTPGAARLLHLLSQKDGVLEREVLRGLSRAEDEAFDEALALLRRREFLLQRTARRPLALANPLWRDVVNEGVRRYPRHAHCPAPNGDVPGAPVTPLARALQELLRVDPTRRDSDDPAAPVLARVFRVARGRMGLPWNGVRGRIAVLAARLRLSQERYSAAERWAQWGFTHLDPEIHPGLRRDLYRIRTTIHEIRNQAEDADRIREDAWKEATAAGHLVAAARLGGVLAESNRRRGRLTAAESLAETAFRDLSVMGLETEARRVRETWLRTLVEARHLNRAEFLLERNPDPDDTVVAALTAEIMRLRDDVSNPEAAPGSPFVSTPEIADMDPALWDWGLERQAGWIAGCVEGAALAREILNLAAETSARRGQALSTQLAETSQNLLLATWMEWDLWRALARHDEAGANTLLESLAALLPSLDAPRRVYSLSEALRTSPAVGLPAFRTTFRPLVIDPPREPGLSPPVRVVRFGRPRVEYADSDWPMSSWPEWWVSLWTAVLAREAFGSPISRVEAETLLRHADDAPEESLEFALHRGNELLRGPETITGGLYLEHETVVMNWSGIAADGTTWEEVEGSYFAGLQGPEIDPARARVHESLSRSVIALLNTETLPTDTVARLLEGAGRLPEIRAEVSRLMDRRNRPRLAHALRRGSA